MKGLVGTVLLLLVAASLCRVINAQQTNTWVEFSPGDELFRISMPQPPSQEKERSAYGELRVNGKRYIAGADGASYAFWSLVEVSNRVVEPANDRYLDACADLVWESMLKPARDKISRDRQVRAGMTYVKDLPSKPLPGREYSITLGELTGTMRFYVANLRIYVLLTMNTANGAWERERFFESFTLKPGPPMPQQLNSDEILNGNPIGSGGSEQSPYADHVFASRETTERARILEKPGPTYTESARKYGVQGTVVLRAVFSKDAEVTNIHVVRKLPHGLTEAAISAARAIRFTPAMKDGHPVSMYMELQYNFNLF
jgi:TonB family protein